MFVIKNLSFATGANYWYFQCIWFSDCCPSVLIFLLAPVFMSFTSSAVNTSMVLNCRSCCVNFMPFITFEFNYVHLQKYKYIYICNQPSYKLFVSINYNSIPGRNPPWYEGTSSLFRVEVWFLFIHLPILQDVFTQVQGIVKFQSWQVLLICSLWIFFLFLVNKSVLKIMCVFFVSSRNKLLLHQMVTNKFFPFH